MQLRLRSVIVDTSEDVDFHLVELPDCMVTVVGQPMVIGIHVEPDSHGQETRIWYMARKEYSDG